MKVIILCAGRGSRTNLNFPKCLYEFKKNLSLLENNLSILKKNNVKNKDIVLATGFKKDLIRQKTKNKYTYILNKKYKDTNMVYSLYLVLKNIGYNNDIIVIYSDIIFEKKNLSEILLSKKSIVTLVDKDWFNKWKFKENYKNDLEELKIKDNKILFLGKKTDKLRNISGRFVGITKISKNILRKIQRNGILKNEIKKNIKIDFTNFLMKLIKNKIEIFAIRKKINWYEFDKINDFHTYKNTLK